MSTMPSIPSPGALPNPGFLGLPAGSKPPTPTPGPFTPQQFQFGFNGKGGTSGIQSELGSVGDVAQSDEAGVMGESQGILDFASGNPTDSPLYKSLLSQSRSQIGNSYDQAVSNVRSSAASRGFGYQDPMEQGGEAGMRGEEAGALSAAPSTALQETIAPELQAAGIETTQGGIFAGQEQQDLQDVSALQQSRNQKQASMTNSFAQLAGDAMKAATLDDSSQYGSL